MNKIIESRILSILRPGDMLRFAYQPKRNGRVGFHIDGAAGKEADDSILSERMSLVLSELRSAGYQFDDSSKRRSRASSPAGAKDSIWLELRPRIHPGAPLRIGRLGFEVAEEVEGSNPSVCLPDFPPSAETPVSDSPLGLIGGIPSLECLELEFVQADLSPEAVKPLEQALNMHMVAQGMVSKSAPPLIQTFIASWLWQRRGWKLTLRVQFPADAKLPIASLEMIGRDIFGCDCELISGEEDNIEADCIDLGRMFPRGWKFPALIPSSEDSNILEASRLHNESIPALPAKGLRMGKVEGKSVRLPFESRDRHTYIVGGTGTGKSTLLSRMIQDDIKRGEGVILLDPHGDLYKTVLDSVPKARRKDVFCIDPSAEGELPGLNILDLPESRLRARHASFLVGELFRFFDENWNMYSAGGPTFEMYFRNTLMLLCLRDDEFYGAKTSKEAAETDAEEKARKALNRIMSGGGVNEKTNSLLPEGRPLSLADFSRVMTDKEFRDALLERCPDKTVVDFWENMATRTSGDYQLANFVPYITSKINALVQTGFLGELLCASRNDLRIGERMNRGEIVLVNLNKGVLGGYESRLFGTILMMEIFAAGLHRSQMPEKDRRPVNLYVDEFQNFVSDNVASMLSEARKFGLRLTLANQTLGQLRASYGRQDLLETVLGNVGNIILFRLGVPDSNRLQLFTEPYTRQQMQDLPNYHALVRLLTAEGPVRPFVMKTLPPK